MAKAKKRPAAKAGRKGAKKKTAGSKGRKPRALKVTEAEFQAWLKQEVHTPIARIHAQIKAAAKALARGDYPKAETFLSGAGEQFGCAPNSNPYMSIPSRPPVVDRNPCAAGVLSLPKWKEWDWQEVVKVVEVVEVPGRKE